MSKYLKILVPAAGGTAMMLALSYTAANHFVEDPQSSKDRHFLASAEAQEAPEAADGSDPDADAASPPKEATDEKGMASAPSRDGGYGLGRAALEEEIVAWDIDIRPDGTGLPEGSGDVWGGEEVFVEKCASCHGDFGEAIGRWPQLAGGFGTLTRADPVKTVGSYWPYLSTVWDYVHRAMPFGDAQSLTADEVYALTAHILYLNDIVDEDFVLTRESFADVVMPNADGFYPDDRADTELEEFARDACMENCKDSVEITMRAAVLDVTPGDGTGDTEAQEAAAAEPEVEETTGGDVSTADAVSAEDAQAPDEVAAARPDATTSPGEAGSQDGSVEPPDPELVAAGEGVFRRCQTCHQVGKDAENRAGPVLNDVIGREAGSVPDFRYSPALTEAGENGLIWTHDELAQFLADPRGYLKGNRMSFQGLRSEEEIDAVIAFLESHGE